MRLAAAGPAAAVVAAVSAAAVAAAAAAAAGAPAGAPAAPTAPTAPTAAPTAPTAPTPNSPGRRRPVRADLSVRAGRSRRVGARERLPCEHSHVERGGRESLAALPGRDGLGLLEGRAEQCVERPAERAPETGQRCPDVGGPLGLGPGGVDSVYGHRQGGGQRRAASEGGREARHLAQRE